MIGYVTLGSNDVAQAANFYDALLTEIGASRAMSSDTFVAWTTAPNRPGLSVIKPADGNTATNGNGTMVALAVAGTADVDRLHAKALALGATDEGAPGPRGAGFYVGYFRDLDGNKLNFFCQTPTE